MKRGLALVVLVLSAPALAGPPHKVLVLPLDGNADLVTRTKLTASVQRLARVLDGDVQPGDTTFADTAVVVGCDPRAAACAEAVRATLGVDELVYGTVTVQKGQLAVIVRRKVKDVPPRELSTTMSEKDPPASLEPALLPLFSAVRPDGKPPDGKPPDGKPPDGKPPDGNPPDKQPDTKLPDGKQPDGKLREPGPGPTDSRRSFAIAGVVGGSVMFVIGLTLWSSKSGLQTQIDSHPTDTLAELQDLKALEDKASTRAWLGNLLVIGGLGLGGYAGYVLYKDHKAPRVMVTPMPLEGGGGVTLSGGFR